MLGDWFKRNRSTNGTSNGHHRNGNHHTPLQIPGGERARYLIELRQVVKTYQSAAGAFTALKGVDLQVDSGELVAVVGKSGSELAQCVWSLG